MPLVTIIIPTYNRSGMLRYTLQSVVRQDFSDFEVEVVGDCCTDNTEEVVHSFQDSRIHWTNLPSRIGMQSGPNNVGIQKAKGKYIAYLGHDDLWFPHHLSTLVELLEKGADFTHSLTAGITPTKCIAAFNPFSFSKKNPHPFTPPSSWVYRLSIIDKIGYWRTDPENLFLPIDAEFFQRALDAEFRFHFSPRLSVIKFASPDWKSYALTEFPQEAYLQKLLEDPNKLELQLLTSIAIDSTKTPERKKPLFRKAISLLLVAYGKHRWPLKQLFQLRRLHQLKKRNRLRGLC